MTRCDFSGIREKLKRSHENILSLQSEINEFIESGEFAVFSFEDKVTVQKAAEYHRHRVIPLRFSVLAGEIIHHLRSCLDHIAWELSGNWYRQSKSRRDIRFPVFEKCPPPDSKRKTGYERQVLGISSPAALILIEWFQPFMAANPQNSPLLIAHTMDITDKHQSLVLCGSTGTIPISADVLARFGQHRFGVPRSEPVDIAAEFRRDPRIYAQVSFKRFGTRDSEPVIQGLGELQNFVVRVTELFERTWNT